ncbi:MAG: VanW family protein [Anaerolinea sp.]|nr:VanW family protein [Anaerolinea sp.]
MSHAQVYSDDLPAFSPWLIRLPILFISGVILLFVILAGLILMFEVTYQGRMYPGVASYGVALGGMTPAEAQTALDARFTYDDQAVFTFRYGEQFWQARAGELGVSFDAAETIKQAYNAGRGGNFLSNLVDQVFIWLNGENITPIIRYDQNVAAARLMQIAGEINRPARDAVLHVDGTNISATPGEVGRYVDITSTLYRLDSSILSLSTGGEVNLVVNETPPVSLDAESAAERARIALSAPVIITANDADGNPLGPWTATVDQIARLLRIQSITDANGRQTYEVTVDVSPFRASLERLAPGVIASPRDARYHFNESTRQLEVIQSGRSGRTLDVDATLARLEAAIFSPNSRVIGLQFHEELPRYSDYTTAAELGITELVSTGTSFYTGSSRARIDNIILAATRFDGIVIAPGELFSFNRYVGDISPEAGFVEGFVIVGDRTVRGVGGGVCQVSTTAFRAAFYGGYDIEERHAHGYRVGYYEIGGEGVGMDAAIYIPDYEAGESGELDFTFRNDTPYHLLIETTVYPGSSSLEFRFYSTNPGRRVIKENAEISEVEPPAATQYVANPDLAAGQQLQVDWAAEGAYVRVTRVIVDTNGNEIDRFIFASRYQPWGAVIQVAPGDSRLSG